VGLRPDAVYTAAPAVPLVPGEIVVLLTDGFEEAVARGERVFGIERIFRIVREHRGEPSARIVRALCDGVHEFLQGEPQGDDITVVVAKVAPEQASHEEQANP
jgi:serine phosphatase RsbU (regulator of sigma subunit)